MRIPITLLLLVPPTVHGLVAIQPSSPSRMADRIRSGDTATCLRSFRHRSQDNDDNQMFRSLSSIPNPLVARQHILRTVVATIAAVVATGSVSAWAEDDASNPRSIAPCRKQSSGTTNCVSTSSVKQLDLYSPPWTFESSPEEAAARLKGVIASDANLQQLEDTDTDAYFLRVEATRGLFQDTIEFSINPTDKFVTFRCEQKGEPSISDFGAIRKQMESIRQRAGIFSLQGQGFSADTMPSQNGPTGQLKAFFGLQSGTGFEDVYKE